MAKARVPLGLRTRKESDPTEESPVKTKSVQNVGSESKDLPIVKKKKKPSKKGRPSTKKGKKLVKYSMDIHPQLKRAVVKAAAIYDKDVHVMWNEIIFDWLNKEKKKNPGWYASIEVNKSEL